MIYERAPSGNVHRKTASRFESAEGDMADFSAEYLRLWAAGDARG
jgi:hypothetical protein